MKNIKCPMCGARKVHILVDAYLCRPIYENYSTVAKEEFPMTFDHFIIECGECGASDQDSPKLRDIARNM